MAEWETLLEFPCRFSIRVMGLHAPGFADLVRRLVTDQGVDLKVGAVVNKLSSKGKYISVTITFTAASKVQLDAIYHSLSAHKRVVMAL